MSNVDASRLAIVSVRALMLGVIVFGAITAIPNKDISNRNKLMISAIVVVLYALLDYFAGFFGSVRTFFCRTACGCTPGGAIDVDALAQKIGSLDAPEGKIPVAKASLDTDSLSTEVEAAIKLLDNKLPVPEEDPISAEAAEEEEAAKKAMGLHLGSEEEAAPPVPAETKEGFVNYSSW